MIRKYKHYFQKGKGVKMRKMKAKLLGVFLAASMAMSAVVPMYGIAAGDTGGSAYADGSEQDAAE